MADEGEWIPLDPGTDPRLPAHLRSDAPRQQCNRCRRWTVAVSEFDMRDTMTQPDGRPCGGVFAWSSSLSENRTTLTPTEMVREFHEAFAVAINAADTRELRSFRAKLIDEEQREVWGVLMDADWEGNVPVSPTCSREEIAKELADLVYVTYGTAVSLGIDLDEAVRRVHDSNMSKRNPDGTVTYRADGKVLKPATYEPPDMTGVAG